MKWSGDEMVNFGWDYPPGCDSVPGDEPEMPCEICGRNIDECLCPECPVCFEFGQPGCYPDHRLYRKVSDMKRRGMLEHKWEIDAESVYINEKMSEVADIFGDAAEELKGVIIVGGLDINGFVIEEYREVMDRMKKEIDLVVEIPGPTFGSMPVLPINKLYKELYDQPCTYQRSRKKEKKYLGNRKGRK